MKYLYKYPCDTYPYEELARENQRRSLEEREYELIDTGLFDKDRYFDIYIEYAKASRDDICMKIEVINRSFQEESIHVIPQVIFRNTWSWGKERLREPEMKRGHHSMHSHCIELDDSKAERIKHLNFDYQLNNCNQL